MFKKIKSLVASSAKKSTIHSVNMVSGKGIYQPKEPVALQKYKKK